MNLKKSPFAIQDKNARDLDNAKYYLMNESQITFIMIVNFQRLVNSLSRKLTEGI